ncbi:MAG: hypothetical protein MJZ65_05135 [Paludibacteraceae bacterium]|nr:hypothetical protein [Paludibacteraceae bacterium]
MKKINLIAMLVTMAAIVNAQQTAPQMFGIESELVNTIRANGGIVRPSLVRETSNNPLLIGHKVAPRQTATLAGHKAGYANPQGTFFLGMDKKGEGRWMASNGVIGAWSDTINCWIWPNTTEGDYTNITYENRMMVDRPSQTENALYGKDKKDNYLDSVTSAGGWGDYMKMGVNGDNMGNGEYSWKFGLPVQTVDWGNGEQEQFQLLQSADKYGVSNSGLVAGGLPSGHSLDGMWPLTQAEPIQADGLSMEYQDADKNYLFGPNMTKMVTVFDRPQAPLYVKDITLAMTAKGYSKASKDKFKFTKLHLEIQDMQGNVLAQSDATDANVTDISYVTHPGKLVTFNLNIKQSSYGEPLSEGILLKDSFQIVLTDFVNTDLYGIFAAKANTHASNTYQWNEAQTDYNNGWEPYVQLNGIMPRWEYYANFVEAEKYGYRTGVRGDTIDINFVTTLSPSYKYEAHFAGEDYANGSEFDIYSSLVPYDSITRLWKMDIDKPEYIHLYAGYEDNVGTEEDPITLWDWIRAFWLKIYAIDTPVVGDHIQIGMMGKYTYFNIVSVDGVTALQAPTDGEKQAGVRKVMDARGRFRILRGNQLFTIQGMSIR